MIEKYFFTPNRYGSNAVNNAEEGGFDTPHMMLISTDLNLPLAQA